jgi:hypothetical protein
MFIIDKIAIYRTAIGIAIGTVFILIWLSLGVGIIGSDGEPANLMYFIVISIGVIGSIFSRLKPQGMALTLIAMAIAQAVIALIAVFAGLGVPWSGPMEILLLNSFFIVMFLASAWLFSKANALSS